MKFFLAFFLAVGLCTCNALPTKKVADDPIIDFIKDLTQVVEAAVDASATDIQQFIQWLEAEGVHLQPEIEKAGEALVQVGKAVLADVIEFNHDVTLQALMFIGNHSKEVKDIYGLVQDAMKKIDAGDTAGLQKDIEAIVGDLEVVLKDLGVVLKNDVQMFLQWVEEKWEALKPLLDSALQALETLANDFGNDFAVEWQTLMKSVADFFEAHKDLFTAMWRDILQVLKSLGIPVHDITDLTPAIQDAEQMAQILQTLAKDFEPTAKADADALLAWAQAEYKKIQPTIQADIEVVKKFVQEVLDEVNKVGNEEIDDTVQFYNDNKDAVNSALTDVVNGIHALQKGDASEAEKDFESAAKKGKALLEDLAVILKKRVEEFIAWAKQEWVAIKAKLQVLVEQLKALGQDIFQELQDAANTLEQQLQQFYKDHEDEIKQFNALFQKFLNDLGLTPA